MYLVMFHITSLFYGHKYTKRRNELLRIIWNLLVSKKIRGNKESLVIIRRKIDFFYMDFLGESTADFYLQLLYHLT